MHTISAIQLQGMSKYMTHCTSKTFGLSYNVTYHKDVAIINPTPMQSINTTHRRNLRKPMKPNLSTIANPTDEAEIENVTNLYVCTTGKNEQDRGIHHAEGVCKAIQTSLFHYTTTTDEEDEMSS